MVLLYKGNDIVGIGKRNRLYEIVFELNIKECLNVESENDNVKLWYKRLGHMSNSF